MRFCFFCRSRSFNCVDISVEGGAASVRIEL